MLGLVSSLHCGQIFRSRVISFSFSYLPVFGQKTNKALAVFVYVVIIFNVILYLLVILHHQSCILLKFRRHGKMC